MAGVPVTLTDDAGRVRFEGRQVGGGGSQTLAQVLATGNDGDANGMINVGSIDTGGGGIELGRGGLTNTGPLDTDGADIDPGGGSIANAKDVVVKTGEVFRVLAVGNFASFQVDQAGGGIGFNNTAPLASIPILPAPGMVTIQDIADALVAYGLVLQDGP